MRRTSVRLDFAPFYREYRDSVAHALSLTLGDSDLGSTAADEAFTRAVQRWKKVSNYDNPAGWVYRVGLNWARSWLRRKRLERERTGVEIGHMVNPAIDHALGDALKDLSEDHRAVVVCRFYLDYTIDQTAAARGIAPGTAKSRLSRALTQLRERLPEEYES